MNYIGITPFDIANGPGIRVTLWVSGCRCKCYNCQNPETWDFSAGKLFDDNAEEELFEALDHPWIQGLTISGGHPLEIENMLWVWMLVREVKEKFPDKDIWLYTGLTISYDFFTFDEKVSMFPKIFKYCDVIVDGPFIDGEKDLTLRFRGSKNQRLIDVKETLRQEKIVTLPEKEIIHGQLTDYTI